MSVSSHAFKAVLPYYNNEEEEEEEFGEDSDEDEDDDDRGRSSRGKEERRMQREQRRRPRGQGGLRGRGGRGAGACWCRERCSAAEPGWLLEVVRRLHRRYGIPLGEAAAFCSAHPARALRGAGAAKGSLASGADADVLLLDASSLELRCVIAGGRFVMTPTWTEDNAAGGGVFGIGGAAAAAAAAAGGGGKVERRKAPLLLLLLLPLLSAPPLVSFRVTASGAQRGQRQSGSGNSRRRPRRAPGRGSRSELFHRRPHHCRRRRRRP